jgi:hypothetical protein
MGCTNSGRSAVCRADTKVRRSQVLGDVNEARDDDQFLRPPQLLFLLKRQDGMTDVGCRVHVPQALVVERHESESCPAPANLRHCQRV